MLITLNSTLLSAQKEQFRIIITKTKDKENLPLLYEILQKQNIQQYITQKNGEYFIYSQEFSSKNEALHYLHILKKQFPSAKILQKTSMQGLNHNSSKLSIGLSGALSAIDTDTIKSGYECGLNLRYNFNRNIFTTLEVSYSNVDIYTFYNTYVGIDYLFDSNIFIGIKGGYSILDTPNFSKGESLLMGSNIGYKYQLSKNFDLMFQYSLLYGEHILQSTTDTLKINYFHSLSFTLSYSLY